MAIPRRGVHGEATLFSPCYNLDWIKSCSIFSQSWQVLFLNDTRYPQPPTTTIQLETHLWKGMRGRRMGNGWVVLWRSLRGGQTPRLHIPVPPPHATHGHGLSPSVFGSIHVSPGWWQSGRTLSRRVPDPLCYCCSAVGELSVSDRFHEFLFHRLWRIFLFLLLGFIFTSSKEVMFSSLSAGWFVSRITQNLLEGFQWKMVGGWETGQGRTQKFWCRSGKRRVLILKDCRALAVVCSLLSAIHVVVLAVIPTDNNISALTRQTIRQSGSNRTWL